MNNFLIYTGTKIDAAYEMAYDFEQRNLLSDIDWKEILGVLDDIDLDMFIYACKEYIISNRGKKPIGWLKELFINPYVEVVELINRICIEDFEKDNFGPCESRIIVFLNLFNITDTIKNTLSQYEREYPDINPHTNNFREKNQFTYLWLGKKEKDLPELYKKMKGLYIHNDTTFEEFYIIFSGQPIGQVTSPIRWHNDNASELLYFITQMEKFGLIENKKQRADYQKLKACFRNHLGESFTQQFKDLKNKLQDNLSIEKREAIDLLLSSFQ